MNVSLTPLPAALIESLCSIGYTLETTLVEIIDNSITAKARRISDRYFSKNSRPWIAVCDNGHGMSSTQLVETALSKFHARVSKLLKLFIVALHKGGGNCQLVDGFHETALNTQQITDAINRVANTNLDEQNLIIPGIFGGLITNSWQFDFFTVGGDWIRGPLSIDFSTETAPDAAPVERPNVFVRMIHAVHKRRDYAI